MGEGGEIYVLTEVVVQMVLRFEIPEKERMTVRDDRRCETL
jgi:hypothetical protein